MAVNDDWPKWTVFGAFKLKEWKLQGHWGETVLLTHVCGATEDASDCTMVEAIDKVAAHKCPLVEDCKGVGD